VVDALQRIGDNPAIRAEENLAIRAKDIRVEIEKSGHRTGASCGELMAATAFCARESEKRLTSCTSKVITVKTPLQGKAEYAPHCGAWNRAKKLYTSEWGCAVALDDRDGLGIRIIPREA
jgi:hypothetical protein